MKIYKSGNCLVYENGSLKTNEPIGGFTIREEGDYLVFVSNSSRTSQKFYFSEILKEDGTQYGATFSQTILALRTELFSSVGGGGGTSIDKVGSLIHFAMENLPSNFLLCDGTIYLVTNYPELFSKISNIYGGDGTTFFAVPNLIGRHLQGDNGSNIGNSNGANILNVGQLPIVNASGTIEVSTNTGNIFAANGSYFANGIANGENVAGFITNGSQGTTVNVAGVTVNSFGSNQPHEHPHLVCRIGICFSEN